MKLTSSVALLLCSVMCQFAVSQSTYWIPTNGPGVSSDVRSLAVDTSGAVFAGTWGGGIIWKSTNDGGTWGQSGLIPDPGPVLSISHNARNHLFASVYNKGIYRSTNNGATWVRSDSGLTAQTVRSNFVDKSGTVWVATESGLFRSTNSGDLWSLAKGGYFYNVFLDSSAGIAMEDAVLLYRSTDQGNSWSTHSFTGLSLLGVHPDGSYIASTLTSQIFRSTDFGASWTDLHTGVSWDGAGWSATFTPGGDIFYSRLGAGILLSLDAGKSWIVMNSGLTTTSVLPLLYHPKGYVFVGTGGSGVFRTTYQVDSSTTPLIFIQPGSLDFGKVNTGGADTLSLQVFNGGSHDSLRLGPSTSTNAHFALRMESTVIPPHQYRTATVIYRPTAVAADTGTIQISTNDPRTPVYFLNVSGRGYGLTHEPGIVGISLIPYNSSQARIVWNRSIDDSAGASDPATQYSVWRRVNGTGQAGQTAHPGIIVPSSPAGPGAVWDFITAVPAVGFDRYAAVVPVPYAYSSPPPWYVFIVAVQTTGMKVYLSAPDSIQDPPGMTGIAGVQHGQIPDELILQQNYPNPFNPSTTIRYGLPRAGVVSLIVYNTLGQEVARLVSREQDAGYHEVRFDGTNISSGIYFCRLKAGEYVRTQKILLLR